MQTKYICVLFHMLIKGEVCALWNRFKPSIKTFYWPFQGGTSFVDLLCFYSVQKLLCRCARLFICALWSPAVKGLTSWLSFVVSNCEFVTFPLVSWVRCGTWLYRFLIFALLLCRRRFVDILIHSRAHYRHLQHQNSQMNCLMQLVCINFHSTVV